MQADYKLLEKEVKQTLWAVFLSPQPEYIDSPETFHSLWIDQTNARRACYELNKNELGTPYIVVPVLVHELSWREFIR